MSDKAESELSFEQALSQLERIVSSLEQGELDLTSALAKYEKGVLLLTQCHRLLEHAEQSVAILTGVDDDGKPITAPLDAAATPSPDIQVTAPDNTRAGPNPRKNRKTTDRSSTHQGSVVPTFHVNEVPEPPF